MLQSHTLKEDKLSLSPSSYQLPAAPQLGVGPCAHPHWVLSGLLLGSLMCAFITAVGSYVNYSAVSCFCMSVPGTVLGLERGRHGEAETLLLEPMQT